MLNNILLAAIEVQPIEPSRIIDAAQGAGQGAAYAGQSLAGSLALIALFVGGLILLVGVGLAMAHVTNKLLKAGTGIFLGTVVMYVFLMYPDKVVGIISGLLQSFFKYLS